MINSVNDVAIGKVSEKVALPGKDLGIEYYKKDTTWIPLSADGVVSRTLVQPLARNALVRKFTVRIGAGRADRTTLNNAGQVRMQSDENGIKIIVVDFGMLRTVSGVGATGGKVAVDIDVCSLRAFKGDGFGDTDLFQGNCGGRTREKRSAEQDVFETRTDRVRLKISSKASLGAISSGVYLEFPDLPSDIDIRVNDGGTAFNAPGVAQPNTNGWDADTTRVADLTAALAAITGDPHDASALDANILLSSRIPASLSLAAETVDIAFLARVLFGESEETTIALDEEGIHDIVLNAPSWVARVQEVRMTIAGSIPSQRILPPVGPPRALKSGGDGAAYDLLLDVDHAGAARLDAALPFSELSGVRLPLRAGADGAETRVLLYSGNDDTPTKLVDAGTSKPVNFTPATNDDDVWTTFEFPKAVKLDHALTYWVVVVVGRGNVSWSLGSFPAPAPLVPIRRGAAVGPWHPIPGVTVDGASLGARIRAIGKAPAATPVAPLVVSVATRPSSQLPVTPTAKGIAATWLAGPAVGTTHPSFAPSGSSSAKTITLRITSSMTGTIKLSAVDVVATK